MTWRLRDLLDVIRTSPAPVGVCLVSIDDQHWKKGALRFCGKYSKKCKNDTSSYLAEYNLWYVPLASFTPVIYLKGQYHDTLNQLQDMDMATNVLVVCTTYTHLLLEIMEF